MLQKAKQCFSCTNCQHTSGKWQGNCPECGQWNTFVEECVTAAHTTGKAARGPILELRPLNQIAQHELKRITTHCGEWDRVLGGGLMPGSFIMLTGDPGIGKSTLLLQIAHQLAHKQSVFYFSSEESLAQVRARAQRIGAMHEQLLFSDSSDLDAIIATALAQKPAIIIVDSIQNCYLTAAANTLSTPAPGSIGQLREAGFRLMRLAKEENITIIATGHITKEGVIAGPKTLEHMVDAVFYLQGEDKWDTRMLRAVKNRFGSINELGFFHMDENGLKEIPDINEHVLQEASCSPGAALISYTEGSRPLLLEVQALTIPSKLGIPQRVITGADHKHVVLIAAILEKYVQVKLSMHDIFFKVSGGFKIKESSADLGIALALLSSYFQQALPARCLALGEISLTGTIKPVNHFTVHMHEAQKFGFKQLFVAKNQSPTTASGIARVSLGHVYELLSLFQPS